MRAYEYFLHEVLSLFIPKINLRLNFKKNEKKNVTPDQT